MATYTHNAVDVPSGIPWSDLQLVALLDFGSTFMEFLYQDGTILRISGSGFTYNASGPTGGLVTSVLHTDASGTAIYESIGGVFIPLVSLYGQPTAAAFFNLLMSGVDTLNGYAGDDFLLGGPGGDTLNGGGGFDFADYFTATSGVVASLADPSVNTGHAAGDTYVSIEGLWGSTFADTLIGDGNVNQLHGDSGNDRLDGGAGADRMFGGTGDDTYVVDNIGDVVFENPGEGIDTVETSLLVYSLLSGDNVIENLTFTGVGNFTGTGNSRDNVIIGGAGNDLLSGGGGRDTLVGGAGDDVLFGGGSSSLPFGDGSLSGGDGSDTLHIVGNATVISGGAGYDYAYFDSFNVNVALDLGAASIEWVQANSAHDLFYAGAQTQAVTIFAGGGSDQITGSRYNDTLNGGHDSDLLNGGAGDDALDGGVGPDTAVYIGFRANYTISGTLTNFTITNEVAGGDGTDTVRNVEFLQFADGTFTVANLLGLPSAEATHDFNGDGHSDILFQHTNGQLYQYQTNGLSVTGWGFVTGWGVVGSTADPNWHVVATGHFNGDGMSDVLFQHTNGQLYQYQMNGLSVAGEGFVGNNTDPNLHVVATGDFNGDGRSDILFQHTNGQLHQWYEWDTISRSVIGEGSVGNNTDPNWHVVATGDFNSDGRSDILFQHTNGQLYQYQMNGLSVTGWGFVGSNSDPNWQVVATGDFDGDGRSDILFQHTSGQLYQYQMDGLSVTGAGFVGSNSDPNWQVVAAGDFNGDGRSDILFQHTNGQLYQWQMDGLSVTGAGFVGSNTDPGWQVVL